MVAAPVIVVCVFIGVAFPVPVVLVVFVPVAAAFVGVPEWVRVSVALPAVGDGPAVLFIGVLDPLNFVPDVGRPVVQLRKRSVVVLVPHALCYLATGVVNHTVPMEFGSVKLALVHLPVSPHKSSISLQVIVVEVSQV